MLCVFAFILLICNSLQCTEKSFTLSRETRKETVSADDRIASEKASSQIPLTEIDKNNQVALKRPTTSASLGVESVEFRTFTPIPKLNKSPPLAALLANAFPGLGQLYVGNRLKAVANFGEIAGLVALTSLVENTTSSGMILMSNLYSYNIYAAYRDARQENDYRLYNTRSIQDSLADLIAAPFNPKIIMKPEVWGGVLGIFGSAILLANLCQESAYKANANLQPLSRSHLRPHPLFAFPIGIGEEAMFRGCIQHFLTEYTNPMIGITLGSILFSAAHISNAQNFSKEDRQSYYAYTLPFLACVGGYLGCLAYKNQSIKESVAVHAWYDFIILSIGRTVTELAVNSENRRPVAMTINFSF